MISPRDGSLSKASHATSRKPELQYPLRSGRNWTIAISKRSDRLKSVRDFLKPAGTSQPDFLDALSAANRKKFSDGSLRLERLQEIASPKLTS